MISKSACAKEEANVVHIQSIIIIHNPRCFAMLFTGFLRSAVLRCQMLDPYLKYGERGTTCVRSARWVLPVHRNAGPDPDSVNYSMSFRALA